MTLFITIMMYVLWIVSISGIVTLVFTGFQYMDLNIIVFVLVLFTVINSFLDVHKRK